MIYRTVWMSAIVACGLAAPAWSQSSCGTVDQFTSQVVFTGSSLQAFTGKSQPAVNWTYDYTNSREAFQYLASDGSVAQTVIYLYRNQLQYVITHSSGSCQVSPLLSSMQKAVVPGSFVSATDWTIGATLPAMGFVYNSLFSFGPILPNVPANSILQCVGQRVELVMSQSGCIPLTWSWNWGLTAVVADFRNYVPSVNPAVFMVPQNCSMSR
jgi:hypothetical protein